MDTGVTGPWMPLSDARLLFVSFWFFLSLLPYYPTLVILTCYNVSSLFWGGSAMHPWRWASDIHQVYLTWKQHVVLWTKQATNSSYQMTSHWRSWLSCYLQVLNCWANDGRFWYVHVWHPGLGVRASTMPLDSNGSGFWLRDTGDCSSWEWWDTLELWVFDEIDSSWFI